MKAVSVVKYGFPTSTIANDSTFITIDGGISWSPLAVQPKISERSRRFSIQGLYTNGQGTFGTIVSLSEDSSSTVLLTESTDDGSSWEEKTVQTPLKGSVFLIAITFLDSNRAILTGNSMLDTGLVMKTWDGGGTWSTIFFDQIRDSDHELTRTGILTSDFLDSLHGIAGIWDGVMETSDGGRSWSKSDGRFVIPTKLFYIDFNNALGVNGSGTIMKGSRFSTSVSETKTVPAVAHALVVYAGDRLTLSRFFSGGVTSFVMVDLVGNEVNRGSFHEVNDGITAPENSGFYLITAAGPSINSETIRLIVVPR